MYCLGLIRFPIHFQYGSQLIGRDARVDDDEFLVNLNGYGTMNAFRYLYTYRYNRLLYANERNDACTFIYTLRHYQPYYALFTLEPDCNSN